MEEKNKITFELVSDKIVRVLVDGKQVGDIWSELKDGSKSFQGTGTLQICGFIANSVTWKCGRYADKKDMCIRFV